MKKLPFLAVLLLGFFVSKPQADNSSVKKVKPFKAHIKTIDNRKIKASLTAVNDSQIVVKNSQGHQLSIPAENIRSFWFKRKNRVGKGIMTGFNAGLYVLGPVAPLGGIVGGATAALSNKKFIIDGNREAFCDLQPEVIRKLMRK
jgi:hypothetical protein